MSEVKDTKGNDSKELKTRSAKASGTKYPLTPRQDVKDTYHGVTVEDPYRWLENPDSEPTREWVAAQNEVTDAYLSTCDTRLKLKTRLEQTLNFQRYAVPSRQGPNVFFFKNTGLQNQSVLYWYPDVKQAMHDSVDPSHPEAGKEVNVLIDPNTLSKEGTTALRCHAVSEDGKMLAYGVSHAGSDWMTIHVRPIVAPAPAAAPAAAAAASTPAPASSAAAPAAAVVAQPQDLPDKLEWVKFTGICWSHDSKGFFYNRYPAPKSAEGKASFDAGTETDANSNQAVYYHRVGTAQSEDVLVYSRPDQPKWMFGTAVSDDGKFVVMTISEDCEPVNRLAIARFDDLKLDDVKFNRFDKFVNIVTNKEAQYTYVTNKGDEFWFLTTKDAPKSRVVAINFNQPEEKNWREIVPQTEDVLEWAGATCGRSRLLLCYLQHVKNVLKMCDMDGKSIEMNFGFPGDGIGSLEGVYYRHDDHEIYYKFTSFLYPGTIHHVNLLTGQVSLWQTTNVPGLVPADFKTQQVFYPSKDGTRIPMFLISPNNVKADGNNPVFLYGYGGFNISLLPGFSASRVLFAQHFGGIVAIPNIRGGGEYGIDWHKAAIHTKRQTAFNDFIAAAEYLIEQKYTKPSLIAINGGSNGGTLVATCANQRPDLYGCVVPQVGVLDMLRFHQFTIGYAWVSDYGCSDNKEHFEALIKYSPYHNIPADKVYPATLVMTADHDDRVVPAHSFKFIAALQHALGEKKEQVNPVMIKIEVKAGHGAGKPLSKTIEEVSDMFGFIAKSLNLKWHD